MCKNAICMTILKQPNQLAPPLRIILFFILCREETHGAQFQKESK